MHSSRFVHERVQTYARQDAEALLRDFSITKDGLSAAQAAESRARFGSNRPAGRPQGGLWLPFCRAFCNPFSAALLFLASLSLLTALLSEGAAAQRWGNTVLIALMLLLGGLVRFAAELRAGSVAARLTGLVRTAVQAKRDGCWQTVFPSELVVGDTVRFHAGDRVPADIRILRARELFVSQSALTGESAVLSKNGDTLSGKAPVSYADYTNILFMGSCLTGGEGEGVVLAVGRDTAYGCGGAASLPRKKGFDRGALHIARVLFSFMAVLLPLVWLICFLTKGDWAASLLFAVSASIGLTPQLLPMVSGACLAKGAAAMGRQAAIVRSVDAMQGFGCMDVLCVDKTGTLTSDVLSLEYYMDVLGNESAHTLRLAYLNSLYHSGAANPLDTAILHCASLPGEGARLAPLSARFPKLDELPFDYARRLASVLVQGEKENLLLVKGSVSEVCRRCTHILHHGRQIPIDGQDQSSVHAIVDEMTEDGMKVLAVACRPFGRRCRCAAADEADLTLVGYLAFFDAPKAGAADALRRLKEAHVDVKVLTGDETSVALSVCRRLLLDTKHRLTGRQIDLFSDMELRLLAPKTSLFTELSPAHKARIVQALQADGHTVGFLGDGLNDLQAMAAADVAVAADGALGAVQESADVVLLQKDLRVVGRGILEGRRAFANVSKYLRITASSNFGNICAVVLAAALLPFLPMTAVQFLLLTLLYDALCLVLPWDGVDEELTARPRDWSGRTLGRFMRFFGPLSSVFDLLTFAFLYFILCPAVCGGAYHSLAQGAAQAQFAALFQTGWFLESMWSQVLILCFLRTPRRPFVQSRPAGVVLLITGLGVVLFTALVYTPLGAPLGLIPLPPLYFVFLPAVLVLYALLVTAAKALYTRRGGELL